MTVLLAASIVAAGTTGQLGGYVADGREMPLAGVSVTVSSPAQIGQPQVVMTDARGYFSFPRLAPGMYSVRLGLHGYASQELTEVQVRVDRVTEIRAALPPSSFGDEVLVVESTPVVDPAQVSTGQTFTSEFMTRTASQWQGLILQTAGTSPYNFRRIVGSTPQDNTFLLDGFDATNWYDRYPNLAAVGVPFDAVRETSIHTAGFEAEYGQATGGVVNVVTKSGGNQFNGTLDVRYTDTGLKESGDHYDPENQASRLGRVTGTLGGPILRDRLWFFTTVGATNYKNTPTGSPTTLDSNSRIFLGKLSWQPTSAWSLVGRYSYAPSELDNVDSSPFRSAEATSSWENDPTMASLELVGTLSSRTLWSLRLGHNTFDHTELPADGDFETIGHVNLTTAEFYGNRGDQWYGESSLANIASDLTWFSPGWGGSHEIKGGLAYGEPRFTDDWCRNGGGRCAAGVDGFFFRDVIVESGAYAPRSMEITRAEGPLDYRAHYYVAYLQDAWRVLPKLTLKLGLRWDRVSYEVERGEIADLSKLQPRVGLAWDPTGNGRGILRASWGRFMHPGTAHLAVLTAQRSHPIEYWGSCSSYLPEWGYDPGLCPALAAMQGIEWRADPENWDPAGWFLTPENVRFEEPHRTADDLRAGYVDQWVIGFERELFRRTSLELSFVHKESRDLFDDTCNGNIPEPTPESACDYLIVANLPPVKLDYQAWMLRFETRALDWLHLLASWVVSDSNGSVSVNTGNANSFDIYPYHFVNRYGFLPDQSRHRLKLNGFLLLPYDFSIAVNGWFDSEYRWTPTEELEPPLWGSTFLEPRGNRDAGSYHQLDLQFGKGFTIGPTHLELLATVVNVLDTELTYLVCENVTGCGTYEMGDTIAWQQPRRYGLGFRVAF